ncbi:hypothetical protein ACFFIX_19580 [Metabacillus herbersteinensis]|uniref:Response regulatory domain-containing protein n=1 Tax=Metabacillus herbersteinensis TaxID=283816 RepID=A0ABV6GIS3_9BACI
MPSIYVFDEQVNFREGIKNLLEIKIHKCNVSTFNNGIEKRIIENNEIPDLVLIDPTSLYEESLELIDYFISKRVKVVLLSSLDTNTDRILLLLKKKLSGYLLKSMKTSDLLGYIGEILLDKRYIAPSIAIVLLDNYLEYENHKNRSLTSV